MANLRHLARSRTSARKRPLRTAYARGAKTAGNCYNSPLHSWASGSTDRLEALRQTLQGVRHGPCSSRAPEVWNMLDRSLGGLRCHTARPIAHHGGYLPRKVAGTIRYTNENPGRPLM